MLVIREMLKPKLVKANPTMAKFLKTPFQVFAWIWFYYSSNALLLGRQNCTVMPVWLNKYTLILQPIKSTCFYSRVIKIEVLSKTCTPLFRATLFIMSPDWKQSKFLLNGNVFNQA